MWFLNFLCNFELGEVQLGFSENLQRVERLMSRLGRLIAENTRHWHFQENGSMSHQNGSFKIFLITFKIVTQNTADSTPFCFNLKTVSESLERCFWCHGHDWSVLAAEAHLCCQTTVSGQVAPQPQPCLGLTSGTSATKACPGHNERRHCACYSTKGAWT